MKLTQHTLAKVAVPSGKTDIIVFDDDVPGFGLRVHAGGTAVWVFQYRIAKLQRRMKLGSAKAISALDARKTASKLHARVMLGEDVAGQKAEARTKAAETFGAILPPFLTEKKTGLKPRTYEEVERHLLKHSKPLHGLQLTGIARRTVATLLTGLAANNGPNLANSVRATLSSLFAWAMAKGQAEANPVIGTEPAVTKGARDRVLTDDELAAIWTALGDDPYGDIVKLLALTGQRRDEIGSLRWAEIDFDKAVIALPPERTKNSRLHDVPLSDAALAILKAALPPERTKNSRLHDVPLSDAALAILKARPRLAGSDYVFTTGANGFRGWSNYKTLLDSRIAAKGAIADWRLHDLRRTVSTRMHDELGVLPHIVEAVLNHVSGHKAGVAGTYNRSTYDKQKREALSLWSARLTGIVGGEPSKVVAIKPSARR
jgi:integrase